MSLHFRIQLRAIFCLALLYVCQLKAAQGESAPEYVWDKPAESAEGVILNEELLRYFQLYRCAIELRDFDCYLAIRLPSGRQEVKARRESIHLGTAGGGHLLGISSVKPIAAGNLPSDFAEQSKKVSALPGFGGFFGIVMRIKLKDGSDASVAGIVARVNSAFYIP